MAKIRENLSVGKADTAPTAPAHISGVHQGNAPGNYGRMRGHRADGTSTAARSTGVGPETSEPILPEMPNLSPA